MEKLTESCAPICGQVGHSYVSLTAWKCHHHGAVTLHLSEWSDGPDETVGNHATTWALGPFDTAADAKQAVVELAIRVALLLE